MTQGVLAGLCKTMAQEWESCTVKSIALSQEKPVEDIAQQISEEILYGGSDIEVLYDHKNIRKTPQSSPLNWSADSLSISREDIFLVTGGARGVTAQCIIELAKEAPCRFLLLGRSTLKDEKETLKLKTESELKRYFIGQKKHSIRDIEQMVKKTLRMREVQKTIETLKSLDCEVLYKNVDVTDMDSLVEAFLEGEDHWNAPITGIIHGAGVLHDRYLGEIPLESFKQVMDTKYKAALNLLDLTERSPLKYICFFSSVAGRWGNIGQSIYAMANEALNKLAYTQKRLRPDCVVKSINWGPWKGGMVDESLARHFEQRQTGLINLEEGARAFVSELRDRDSVETVIFQEPLGSFASEKLFKFKLEQEYSDRELSSTDHRIKDKKILPFGAFLDYSLTLGRSLQPEKSIIQLRHCYCYKGVSLETQDEEELFVDMYKKEHSRAFLLSIHSKYRKYYELELKKLTESSSFTLPSLRATEQKHSVETFPYEEEALFHGKDYQVLDSLLKIDESNWEAQADFSKTRITSKSILWDAGIQLAVLWLWEQYGLASLPTYIKNFQLIHWDFPKQVRIVLRGKMKNQSTGLLDLAFFSGNTLLASIEGLEMTKYFEKVDPVQKQISANEGRKSG